MEFYLIGYSGHAYVVIESALANSSEVLGYFEQNEKTNNPYKLKFMGPEDSIINTKTDSNLYFVGIGNNLLRENIFNKLTGKNFTNIIDLSARVSTTARLKTGIYIGNNACVNALSTIGKGVIINTGAIVEHECAIDNFAHIAPGAILCGNVTVGKNTFVGANAVIKQGVKIGDNVTIGAGSVVIKDVTNNTVAYGNPLKKI